MNQNRARSEQQGRRAEKFAALYLWITGWRILACRVKTQRGEVDIIARRGGTLCFVEVKWRASAQALDTAIDAQRLRRVAAAVEILAPRYARAKEDIRIDVILMAPKRWPRRIANAWQPFA